MKKYIGLYIVCGLLIVGCLAGFFYLSTHDIFKAKETVTLTKSSEQPVVTSEPTDTSASAASEESSEEVDSGEAISAIGDIEAGVVGDNIAILLPSDFVGEITQEKLDEIVDKDDGFISATLNADGSVSYVLTPEKCNEMRFEMQGSIEQTLQEILDSPDYPNIESISHNEDFTEYTITCSSEDLNLTESFLPLSLYVSSGMYFQFLIDKPDNVYITYVNSTTGKAFYESNAQELSEKMAEKNAE